MVGELNVTQRVRGSIAREFFRDQAVIRWRRTWAPADTMILCSAKSSRLAIERCSDRCFHFERGPSSAVYLVAPASIGRFVLLDLDPAGENPARAYLEMVGRLPSLFLLGACGQRPSLSKRSGMSTTPFAQAFRLVWRVRRMLSSLRLIRWALWTTRSRTASA